MVNDSKERKQVGIGEFVRSSIVLPNKAFELAMRFENDDANIDNVKIARCSKEAIKIYERS